MQTVLRYSPVSVQRMWETERVVPRLQLARRPTPWLVYGSPTHPAIITGVIMRAVLPHGMGREHRD